MASAVIAQGTVVVRGRPQLVQHLDGGIVREIHVRDGDQVEKGDLLVRLDETLLLANLEIYRNRLREAGSAKARLEAERDGLPEIVFEDVFSAKFNLGDEALHRSGQRELFLARRIVRDGQIEQLREKIAQSRNQIAGAEGLIAALGEQLSFTESELSGVRELYAQGQAPLARMRGLERVRAELSGQLAEKRAELASIGNAIQESELAILQVRRQFKEAVLTELRQTSTQVEDMVQQIIATIEQLQRIEIRAQVSGMVHEMATHTIGGVIPPGGTLMQLISTQEGVDIEVNVESQSIDQLHIGQQAVILFPAFNQNTTPELLGSVSRISPTSVVDERSGAAFYRFGIDVTPEEIARLGERRLLPGMPAEAHLRLPERTALSYLMKPLTDHWRRAMQER
ncbi:MAG TPA: HlyD family type I secretion periplasmic adaptor subunit, partial [Saliniramus sp.]|nr:HlyD family type I secretion periplasmic adaptor subunit [Saliniramus sp.]